MLVALSVDDVGTDDVGGVLLVEVVVLAEEEVLLVDVCTSVDVDVGGGVQDVVEDVLGAWE